MGSSCSSSSSTCSTSYLAHSNSSSSSSSSSSTASSSIAEKTNIMGTFIICRDKAGRGCEDFRQGEVYRGYETILNYYKTLNGFNLIHIPTGDVTKLNGNGVFDVTLNKTSFIAQWRAPHQHLTSKKKK